MFFAWGKVTLQQKWIQFTWFVEHLFLAPSASDAYAVDRGAPRFLLAEQQSVSVIGHCDPDSGSSGIPVQLQK